MTSTTKQVTSRPHGYARYKLDGCRCYTCGWAVASYSDKREYAMRRGAWQPYTSAQPARDHLRNLQACGLGLRTIAALAGTDRKRLQAILTGRPERETGPQEKIRPALALAILSIEPTPENLAPHTPIDATSTLRRLQALIAAGWPQVRLAARLGRTGANFGALLNRTHVTVATAGAVRVLYAELWNADPATSGITAQAASRARNHAKANAWAPVGAWDDDTIDDPAAMPEWSGACGTPAGFNAHYSHGILPVCSPCGDARRAARQPVLST